MSFRQYGGMNYASKNNIVSSNLSVSNSSSIGNCDTNSVSGICANVTDANISCASITNANISCASINNASITSGSITTASINNGTITTATIANLNAENETITGDLTMTNGDLYFSGNENGIYFSDGTFLNSANGGGGPAGPTGPQGSTGPQGFTGQQGPTGLGGGGYWSPIGPTGIYYSSGPVGIGTSSPNCTLGVSGNVGITGNANIYGTLDVGSNNSIVSGYAGAGYTGTNPFYNTPYYASGTANGDWQYYFFTNPSANNTITFNQSYLVNYVAVGAGGYGGYSQSNTISGGGGGGGGGGIVYGSFTCEPVEYSITVGKSNIESSAIVGPNGNTISIAYNGSNGGYGNYSLQGNLDGGAGGIGGGFTGNYTYSGITGGTGGYGGTGNADNVTGNGGYGGDIANAILFEDGINTKTYFSGGGGGGGCAYLGGGGGGGGVTNGMNGGGTNSNPPGYGGTGGYGAGNGGYCFTYNGAGGGGGGYGGGNGDNSDTYNSVANGGNGGAYGGGGGGGGGGYDASGGSSGGSGGYGFVLIYFQVNNNTNLNVYGNATISNTCSATAFTILSDYRIKDNPVPLNDSYTLDNLNPVVYRNIITNKIDIGLLAHELQEIYSFLVNGEKDGENMQSVNYIGLIGIIIKEMQKLKNEIKLLKGENC